MIEGLTPAQTRALTRINVGASALSFAGTSFIVMCYILFKDLRTFPFKLIFYLSLSVRLANSMHHEILNVIVVIPFFSFRYGILWRSAERAYCARAGHDEQSLQYVRVSVLVCTLLMG